MRKIITTIVPILVIILLLAFACISSVPTGYTGIMTTFGKVENGTLEAGLNFKAPWQSIVLMNNQEQRYNFTMQAFSSDIQQVNIAGSVNYAIDKNTAMTLYREVGRKYETKLIAPRIAENTKAVISRYEAEGLITNRDSLSTAIAEQMREDLDKYGITVISVSIEDVDFSDAFTNAVEAKQVASQEKLRAETEQSRLTMESEQAAKRREIDAEAAANERKKIADAEAYELEVKSKAEAEANKRINESLTPALIEYNYANTWNGQLPTTYMGDGEAIPVMNFEGD